MRARTRELLARAARAGLAGRADGARCSAAYAQLVQVARALAFDCRVLVLDEPTTSLTDAEVDHLFRVLDGSEGARRHAAVRLAPAARGLSAVRSHHRAARRRATSARSSARRRRRTRSCGRWSAASRRRVSSASRRAPRRPRRALSVRGLTRAPCVRGRLARRPRRARSSAIFGLVGSGRTELLETIFGLRAPDAGSDRASTAGR